MAGTVWKRGDIDELMPPAPEFVEEGGGGGRTEKGRSGCAEDSNDNDGPRGNRDFSNSSIAPSVLEATASSPERSTSPTPGWPYYPAEGLREKRAPSAERVPRNARNAPVSGRWGTPPVPGRERGQGRREPPTPRSTERARSPFWVPPPQQPPPCFMPSPSLEAARSSVTPGGASGGSAEGATSGGSHEAAETGGGEPPPIGVCAGVEKGDASAEAFEAMMDAAPDERVRRNMMQAQSIRDRYLRWDWFGRSKEQPD